MKMMRTIRPAPSDMGMARCSKARAFCGFHGNQFLQMVKLALIVHAKEDDHGAVIDRFAQLVSGRPCGHSSSRVAPCSDP